MTLASIGHRLAVGAAGRSREQTKIGADRGCRMPLTTTGVRCSESSLRLSAEAAESPNTNLPGRYPLETYNNLTRSFLYCPPH